MAKFWFRLVRVRKGDNMNICISNNTLNETDEKMLLVILLGIFEAIKSNALSIRDLIFSNSHPLSIILIIL